MYVKPITKPIVRRALVPVSEVVVSSELPPPYCDSSPQITGTPHVGSTLTCDSGEWVYASTFTYQWKTEDNVDIDGADSPTYVVADVYLGEWLRCDVTAWNNSGSSTTSSESVEIVASSPVNTVAPAVTGIAEAGNTLTCSNGTWTGTDITYSYQWESNGVPFAGATASTLLLGSEHKGKPVYCVVTATSSVGATPQASNTVDVSPFPVVTTWNYVTPETGTIPAPGTIVHPNNFVNKMSVSTTNTSGNPVNLSSFGPGDTISFNGQTYVVQATPQFYPEYVAISIEPSVQQPEGTYEVTVDDYDLSAGTYMPNDMDGDGKLDTILHAGRPRVSIDSDSINIDVNNDGKLDFTIPL